MKICTFNVNSIRARVDLLVKWLEKRGNDLDLLCLQELKGQEKDFPLAPFQELGYNNVEIYGQPRYNGVALCSKNKLDDVQKGFQEPSWDGEKRLISCQVKDIKVINLYFPHGDLRGSEKYHYKLEWYDFFLKYLQENHSPQESMVLAGDFNVTLEDRDVYDPELLKDSIGTMPEEREALQKIIDWGLVDAFRYCYPHQEAFTWWSYLGGGIWKNQGMRIDYIFCTRPLLDRLVDVEVDIWPRRRRKPTPSDHAPLVAFFRD